MPKKPRNPKRSLGWGQGFTTTRGEGTVQARWFDGSNWRARTFHAATTDEARDLAEDHVRQQHRTRRRGGYVPPDTLTLFDVIEAWLMRGQSDWKPATLFSFRRNAERIIYPELGDVRVAALDTPRLQHFVDTLSQQYAPATVQSIFHVVRAALRQATQIGQLATSPAPGCKLPSVRRGTTPTWTAGEAQTVLAHLDGQRVWSALYRLALTTGMRPGELLALRWSDIGPDGMLTVSRTMTRTARGEVVVGDRTKTDATRRVAISTSTRDALDQWRTEQQVRELGRPAPVYIFSLEGGQPLRLPTWQKHHEALILATGVTRITLHGLRHTAATLLMATGMNPRVVADLLGHRSIQTTLDTYTHTSQRDRQEAADALAKEIEG